MNRQEIDKALEAGHRIGSPSWAPNQFIEYDVSKDYVVDEDGGEVNMSGLCGKEFYIITKRKFSQCDNCESIATECSTCNCGDNWSGQPMEPITADQHLRHAAQIIEERGKMRDSEEGERSFEKAAQIFNLIYPGKLRVDAKVVIQVLRAVKLARESQGVYHQDDQTDLINYTALLMEEIANAR